MPAAPIPRPLLIALLLVAGTMALTVAYAEVAAAPGAPYRDQVLEDSPRGYWRLDEASGTTAADEAAAGNDAAYTGGVSLGVPGAVSEASNTAVRLDGSNDVVNAGDPADGSLDMGSGDFTVEAWVSATANGERAVVSKKSSSSDYWFVSVSDDSGHVGHVRVKIDDGSVSRQAYGPAIRVDDGAWHHVVVLFDRDTGIRIYVDGVSRLTTGAMAGSVNNSAALRAGAASSYGYFAGRLDELAIYPRLLSDTRIQAHYGAGDTTPPAVTLSTPTNGSTTTDTTPHFSGAAGTATTDNAVSVAIYGGSQATGTPVQTLTAVPDQSGAWSVDATSALASGTYTARATQTDAAGNTGASSAKTFTISGAPPPPSAPVIAAAGDIACDPANSSFKGGSGTSTSCRQMATSNLLVNAGLDAVLAIGDLQYACAGTSAFQQSYEPSWGRVKGITFAAAGNHEYQKSGGTNCDTTGKGTGYFNYFGARAGDPSKGYYSFDLGSWHLIALNSMCSTAGGCSAGSPQEKWLRADLAAHPSACTLAFFHYPRFSSGSTGSSSSMDPFWDALYDYGAEVVLSGHDHIYERFGPQTPNAAPDFARGIREFVVGTGGRSLFGFSSTIKPNSEARSKTYGVLKMVLRPTGYDWEFLAEAGKTFTDSGSTSCH
jgi:hypothetical protein